MKLRSDPMTLLKGRLIVSCQAPAGDAFASPDLLARFAQAAVQGGAAAIRAEGSENIAAIKRAVAVPVIGLRKRLLPDDRIMITPTLEDAQQLVAAGADLIALDCTSRGQRHGALERLRRVRAELRVPVWADIATVGEAESAAEAGADAVLSTLRGYTDDTMEVKAFEASFIAQLVSRLKVPVIAEGRILTCDDAASALQAGAFAIVVGTAITRPEEITRRFAASLQGVPEDRSPVVGVDFGGTNIKSAVCAAGGTLEANSVVPTPAGGGRAALLSALKRVVHDRLHDAQDRGIAPTAIGVATAGWVEVTSGRVLYATENLPGWTGTEIAGKLRSEFGLPVAVENDANALAIAEHEFGAARGCGNFVCLTLGTGVGGGCFVGGRLNRGAHFLANGLGHVLVERNGRSCTCGQRGCLEAYANASALLRYAGPPWKSADEVIVAANGGEPAARNAIETLADWLAAGCSSILQCLDPEMIIIAGGLAQNNPILTSALNERLQPWSGRAQSAPLRVIASDLGYFGGVMGAVGCARQIASE